VPRLSGIESVFLNIPYDDAFENLYLAYIVGLTQLGLRINATLAIPNQGRLATIIDLIEQSNISIHDLSRIELSSGIPRFNMPVELGLALYRSKVTQGRHRVYIFESKPYRTQRSTSDVNGIDPQIHRGTVTGLMAGLRNIFRNHRRDNCSRNAYELSSCQTENPGTKKNAGGQSLFGASRFQDLSLAALVESQKLIKSRAGRKSYARQ
jgi:hypothetical protein